MIDHADVLTHRTLRLTGRTGGEIDIGELVRGDIDAEIAVGMVLLVRRFDEQRLDVGQRREGLVQGGSAGGFGQHETAAGAGQHRRNPISREMRLDRQIHATGLEDREHSGQPIQVALGHHRHHSLRGPTHVPTAPELTGWHGR